MNNLKKLKVQRFNLLKSRTGNDEDEEEENPKKQKVLGSTDEESDFIEENVNYHMEDSTNNDGDDTETAPGEQSLFFKLQQLKQNFNQIKFAERDKLKTKWGEREEILAINWDSIRPELARHSIAKEALPTENYICGKCMGRKACISCTTCSLSRKFLCGPCDGEVHHELHLHKRQTWAGGFYQNVKPHMRYPDDISCCDADNQSSVDGVSVGDIQSRPFCTYVL